MIRNIIRKFLGDSHEREMIKDKTRLMALIRWIYC